MPSTALITIGGAAALLAGTWMPLQSPGPSQPCSLRYVANAGVLVESGNAKFLIDAPIRDSLPPYASPSPELRARVETGQAPYDRLTAILVTHWHEDHFSAEAIARTLHASASTVLVSSQEIVDRVRQADPALPASRFVASTPAPTRSERTLVSGTPVHILRLRHSARRLPEQHVGFLIEGCRTVLHVGDADADDENFALLRGLPGVQVGVLPYWYVLDDQNRAFVARSIRPSRVIGMHLPPADAVDVGKRVASVKSLILLTQPGAVHDLR